MAPSACIFCERIRSGPVLLQGPQVVAFADAFPISEGHSLVVPRRHEASLFELSEPEYAAVWAMVADLRRTLLRQPGPDGFTVGVNVGVAASQTVGHAHVHVIPRRVGDVADPRDGSGGCKPSTI